MILTIEYLHHSAVCFPVGKSKLHTREFLPPLRLSLLSIRRLLQRNASLPAFGYLNTVVLHTKSPRQRRVVPRLQFPALTMRGQPGPGMIAQASSYGK